jgi:hypothetical protein
LLLFFQEKTKAKQKEHEAKELIQVSFATGRNGPLLDTLPRKKTAAFAAAVVFVLIGKPSPE